MTTMQEVLLQMQAKYPSKDFMILETDAFDGKDARDMVCFEHDGMSIHNPFLSDCARFHEDPSYYGIEWDDAKLICKVNGLVVNMVILTEYDLEIYKALRAYGCQALKAYKLIESDDAENELREWAYHPSVPQPRIARGTSLETQWQLAMTGDGLMNGMSPRVDRDGNVVHRAVTLDEAKRADGSTYMKVIHIVESSSPKIISDILRHYGYPVLGTRMADGSNWRP